jgi:hypothetical protein
MNILLKIWDKLSRRKPIEKGTIKQFSGIVQAYVVLHGSVKVLDTTDKYVICEYYQDFEGEPIQLTLSSCQWDRLFSKRESIKPGRAPELIDPH